ncbi:MAG: NADAR family protein [Kofleriaceae bacterium]
MTRFTLFFASSSPFSQWHPCRFTIDGQQFNCTEQYMMYGKAMLFGDRETAAAILAAHEPRDHKALGREVKQFDNATWERERAVIVMTGNRAKFTQNLVLRDALFATRGTTLVEASPTDLIWGIGLAEDDPRALDQANWRGLNLLGKILTELRDELLAAG